MAIETLLEDKMLHQYLINQSKKSFDEIRKNMILNALAKPHAQMNTALDQLQFMGFLIKTLGVRYAIEIGVFRGIGTLTIAKNLPDDGKVIACDITDEYISEFKNYWQLAGVSDKIDLRIAPALETLNKLIQEGKNGTFDFIYIDADKINNQRYYELGLRLLRTGGVIAIDNVLVGGLVADDTKQQARVKIARDLNEYIQSDDRVDSSLLGIGDGLYLVRKK